jgi:hypothetical protein
MHRYDIIDAESLHRIVEDLEPGTAKWRRRTIVIVPLCIAAVVALVGALYYFGDASARKDLISTITNPAIMVPNLVCCIIIPWIANRQARFSRIRGAMLKNKRCPHCGYNLYGLPAAPDDSATVCPECGSAWRLKEAEMIPAAQARPGRRKQMILAVAIAIGLCMLLVLGLLAYRLSG